jgi:hypothetical protein
MPDCASPDDIWLPDQSEQGMDLFNCYERLVLVEGPRKSGKSIAICHKVWRHLWETPGAHVGVFAKTIKSAKDGGSWVDIVQVVGPHWIGSGMIGNTGMPLEYTTYDGAGVPGPRQDGQTRTLYFKIRNMHGGESELKLFSLDNDHEVEAKVKNLRFSMIWFVELSNFKTRDVFNISILSLRMVHLNFNQHQWIADTNPAIEGKDSWIYKLWHVEKYKEKHDKPAFQKNLHVRKFTLDGNKKYLDPRELEELQGTYADDPGEYARNVLGEWTRGKGGSEKHFSDLIKPDLHYIPNSIDIPAETVELLTGWDTGDVNHAAVILEERIVNGTSVFLIHEELEVLGQEISLEQFAYDFYQKIISIEEFYKREFQWEHWSDDTATTAFRSAIGGYDASLILKATQGRVEIQGADKPEGSIAHSIRIIRKLLREHRLFVSETCPQVKRMLEEIEQPNTTPELTVDKYNPLKHIFDALRYPIYMRIRWESFANRPESVKRTGVISI